MEDNRNWPVYSTGINKFTDSIEFNEPIYFFFLEIKKKKSGMKEFAAFGNILIKYNIQKN